MISKLSNLAGGTDVRATRRAWSLAALAATAVLSGCGGGLGSSTVGFEAARNVRPSSTVASVDGQSTTDSTTASADTTATDTGNANTSANVESVSTAAVVVSSGDAGPRTGSFTASGPITATSGQVISGLAISNPNGDCVRISGVSNVVIRDSKIGPCGGSGVEVTGGASNISIEHNSISGTIRGIRATHSSAVNSIKNTVGSLPAQAGDYRHAIEYSWMQGGTVDGNVISGSFPNDVLSGYESDNMRFTNNVFDVSIAEPTGAAFTMGDSTTGHPGANNYIAGNIVRRQSGGVPAGVFGSNGNTVIEKNCFTAGIQAYNYSGVFSGVTVRNNVINMAASFVPDPGAIAGWNSNINSTDCSLVPG